MNNKYQKQRLRFTVVFVPTTRDRLLPALTEGLGDIAVANLTITPERLQHVDFSQTLEKTAPLLLTEINGFLKNNALKSGLVHDVYRRYLHSTQYVKKATSITEMKKYQALLSLFQKYGEKYDFEYLMLLAQGYQESRLDQQAKSPKGAVGIMQLLPSTAEGHPIGPDGHFKIPHLWPGQNPPATEY